DFVIMRTPAKLAADSIIKDNRFSNVSGQYFSRMKETMSKFAEELSSGTFMQVELSKKGLKILNDLECRKVFRELRTTPLPRDDLLNLVDEGALTKMIQKKYVVELNVKDVTYCALLTDLKVEKFRPDYLISNMQEKFNSEEITMEMVSAHLDLLYNAEKQ
ncbi:MAG: hypothetical protein ACFFCS_20785, partial [Candidatus Hodarchaeota archaeon]